MISTMFSSASLSAVTTVVMFLLTYMPYVIVIAMEAVFGIGHKLLIVSRSSNLIIFLFSFTKQKCYNKYCSRMRDM